MSDKFIPTSMHQLTKWIYTELKNKIQSSAFPKACFSYQKILIILNIKSTIVN